MEPNIKNITNSVLVRTNREAISKKYQEIILFKVKLKYLTYANRDIRCGVDPDARISGEYSGELEGNNVTPR